MEDEKMREFISHTRAEPILARQILQRANWDMRTAMQMYTVLRGPTSFHLSGQIRPVPSNPGTSVKPPVAPKPNLDLKPNPDRHKGEGRHGGSKLAPLPPPRARKVGALPKLYHDGQVAPSSHPLPPVGPDVIPLANVLVESLNQKGMNSTRGSLPPIQKPCGMLTQTHNSCPGSDYCSPCVSPPTASVPNINRGSLKSQSGNAKNALLIEKVRGTSANLIDSQNGAVYDSTTRASFSSHDAISSLSQITINSSCIISVNNPNNNPNKNNNIYIDDYSPSSLNNSGTLPISIQTTNYSTCTSSYSSPPLNVQAASKDSSPYSLTAVPSTGPSGVIIYSSNNDVASLKDTKLPVNTSLGVSREYLNSVSDRDTNCTCDCRREVVVNSSKGTANAEQDVKSVVKSGDSVDRAVRPEMSQLSASNTGPSLSAPCSPAKPLLRKTDAVDLEEYDYYKKLNRGISKATDNVNIVSKVRTEFAQEIWEAIDSSRTPFFIETPIFTFTLPDLSIYSDEFRLFLERDLIETSTLVSLEGAGRLNWWALIGASQRLWPLATTGDGNCLLHAASLGMWGFHDRLLTLRKALHEFLTRSQYSRPLWRRWRWQVAQQNRETGLVYSNEEWDTEWANVLRLASSAPRGGQDDNVAAEKEGNQSNGSMSAKNNIDPYPVSKRLSNGFLTNQGDDCTGRVYESLEEIHVLALAHVLRRPIIVVADVTLKDVSGEPLAPIPFGGIYLPLECPPRECQRSPLLLTYDAAHFSALVVMESQQDCSGNQLPAVIPVTDCYHELLAIQFVIDPGEDFIWGHDDQNPAVIQKLTITNHDKIGLLNEYLDISQVPIPPGYLEACQSVEDVESPENYHPEIEKKSSESSFDSDEGPPYPDGTAGIFASKSKASKQLQTVAKQFGSIGKTMSKKIKKNFGTLSKLGRAGSFKKKDEYVKTCSLSKNNHMLKMSTNQSFILAALIHTEKRHAYQEEMVRNYLNTARRRFEKDAEMRKRQKEEMKQLELEQLEHQVEMEGPSECINPGCSMYGTALTSYMCSSCYAKQKEEEQEYKRQTSSNLGSPKAQHRTDGAQYGAGKSKFYAELDASSVLDANKIPVIKPLSTKKDGTIYLSNSTFYSDNTTAPNCNNAKSLCGVQSNGHRTEADVVESQASVVVTATAIASPTIITTTMAHEAPDTFTPVAVDDVSVCVRADIRSESPSQPCLTRDCRFYGSSNTGGYCSQCYQEHASIGISPKSVMVQQIKSVQL
ncbi:OTU domain-containing protein 7A-like [Macrobrachium nipponense]|uniref:OTU domain-containing protein 7A-like n=1 Tax=Macrobrachium nipponense TaxID=159736 RepID=UPI0030C8504F